MSDLISLPPPDYTPGSTVRPLSVRMTDDLRAQLEIIAQLNNRSVTEETRVGLEHWIEKSKSDPKVLERAEIVREEIEREAATKRGAIESIFDQAPGKGSRSTTSQAPTRAAKKDADE